MTPARNPRSVVHPPWLKIRWGWLAVVGGKWFVTALMESVSRIVETTETQGRKGS